MSNEERLNHENPASAEAELGTRMKDIIDRINVLSGDALLAIGTLVISAAAAEQFKTTTVTHYRINGVHYSKAATDTLTFTAAHTVNVGTAAGTFWGVIAVQLNAAGAFSTKVPSADQAYATEQLAINALPAPDAGKVIIGYITIQCGSGAAWVGNTDDMTDASDVTEANFYNVTPPSLEALAPLN